jgi:hypothetical protein
MSERTPAKARENKRDDKGCKTEQVKSAWRRANSLMSLKAWARSQAKAGDQSAANWLFNKTANTSKPPQRIGSTRKKKGGSKPSGK